MGRGCRSGELCFDCGWLLSESGCSGGESERELQQQPQPPSHGEHGKTRELPLKSQDFLRQRTQCRVPFTYAVNSQMSQWTELLLLLIS